MGVKKKRTLVALKICFLQHRAINAEKACGNYDKNLTKGYIIKLGV